MWLVSGRLVVALRRAGLDVLRAEDRVLAHVFPAGDVRFEVTHGGCSCGLVVGPPGAASLNDRKRRRFEERGYSEARIARIFSEVPPRRIAARLTALRSVLAKFALVRICYQRARGTTAHADVEVTIIPG